MRKLLTLLSLSLLIVISGQGVVEAKRASTKKKSSSSKTRKKKSNAPKLIGTYGNWRAYTAVENGNKVCYMSSYPLKETGKYKKRGPVYMVIAHRPYLKSYNVVSFDAGYPFKKDAKIDVKVEGKKRKSFKLFTDKETAWCADAKTDKTLTNAIKAGEKIIVTGKSSRGTKTVDNYSLKGSSAAYRAICKACKVKM